jgi:hypothetical protein
MHQQREGSVIPYLAHSQIVDLANEFLAEHHSGEIPIPIEDIVEVGLNIRIDLRDGLRERFGVDAFLSRRLDRIIVDREVFNHRRRYRFTLAHEIGHLILHKSVYQNALVNNVDDWIGISKYLSEPSNGWAEWQAYNFAGLVLVPTRHLLREAQDLITRKVAPHHFIKPDLPFWDRMATILADKFDVSSAVIKKRFDTDKEVSGILLELVRAHCAT